LSEADKYRQYAKDCVRLASTMSGADRQTLLKIAEAWEGRAREAETKKQNSGQSDPLERNGKDHAPERNGNDHAPRER